MAADESSEESIPRHSDSTHSMAESTLMSTIINDITTSMSKTFSAKVVLKAGGGGNLAIPYKTALPHSVFPTDREWEILE